MSPTSAKNEQKIQRVCDDRHGTESFTKSKCLGSDMYIRKLEIE